MKESKDKARSYSLEDSAKKVGPVVPRIVAADRKTEIDGGTRYAIDPNWPTWVDEGAKTPLDIATRRLITNIQRRTLSRVQKEAALDNYVSELRKDQSKPQRQGYALASEISSFTGFTPRWVYKYLPAKFKSKEGRPRKIERHSNSDPRPWITGLRRMVRRTGFKVANPLEPTDDDVSKFLQLLQDDRDLVDDLIYILVAR